MSSKKLVVVESPAKAKTIKKILGKDFDVKASVGHIRDLKSKGWGKKAFGIDIENGYKPQYSVIKGKEKTVAELKDAAAKADEVYLAPDPDREGEAIAWHLKEIMELDNEKAKRITYQAITPKAVREAVDSPREINMDLVHSQWGRRVLDRLVGFSLSPFLWKKVAKNLSAGRVQSVAVRIVVEREREIQAFEPVEFWKILAQLTPNAKKDKFEAALVRWDGKKFALGEEIASSEENANNIKSALENAEYQISSIDKKKVSSRPQPPFITSTLQQAASTQLRFGTSKTMSVAQKLYEGIELEKGTVSGLITYMRTDSTRIAPEAIEEAREHIKLNYGDEFLPKEPRIFSSSKNAQDAHEAIRPTSVAMTPDMLAPFVTAEQLKLYTLIWRRFVASQMTPAKYEITTLTIKADKGEFEAKGRVTVFDGYTVLIKDGEKKSETEDNRYQKLPKLSEEDILKLLELAASQHFTKPPARYSEASLVKALEKEGIGRPSTYAPIIKTIRDRGYVRLEKRAFWATELGFAVNDILVQNFEDIMELKFTAEMENGLDRIEQGEQDWVELIDGFYKPFAEKLEKAIEEAPALKNKKWDGDEKCPKCEGDLVVRYSRNGAFLGCTNFPDCNGLIAMPGETSDEDAENIAAPDVDCPTCGKPMNLKTSRYGKKFFACSDYPDCKTTLSADKDGQPIELPKIERDCEKCGSKMEVKMGRRGPFLACSSYPDCKNTLPIDKDGNVIVLPVIEGEVCEKCGGEMIVKTGRRGPFLACSNFPKCKNAKPIPKKDGEDDESEEKKEEK